MPVHDAPFVGPLPACPSTDARCRSPSAAGSVLVDRRNRSSPSISSTRWRGRALPSSKGGPSSNRTPAHVGMVQRGQELRFTLDRARRSGFPLGQGLDDAMNDSRIGDGLVGVGSLAKRHIAIMTSRRSGIALALVGNGDALWTTRSTIQAKKATGTRTRQGLIRISRNSDSQSDNKPTTVEAVNLIQRIRNERFLSLTSRMTTVAATKTPDRRPAQPRDGNRFEPGQIRH